VEIASDELITEAEKERTRKVLDDLCNDACASLSKNEANLTARAIFYDAVVASAKEVAERISQESIPTVKEIVGGMLRDSTQHPYIEAAVIESAQPIARSGAYSAIRRWSEEKALPLAEEASRKIFAEHFEKNCSQILHITIWAGVRVILEKAFTDNPQISSAAKEKLTDEYLAGDARHAAEDAMLKSLNADVRRRAQRAAEIAVEEIAGKATDELARAEALDAARVVAIDTAKLEISRLVLAEAQRRSAKIARERLQEEAPAQADDKRVEYCQEVARNVANDAVNSVVAEIADPSVADLDLEKARELALSAASAVAREFSGAYQLTPEYDGSKVSTKTLVFLAIQIFTGCFIVWFFLLGGYETCEPLMKAVLPGSVYSSIYKAVPARHHQLGPNGKGVEVDDLIDDQSKPGGAEKEGGEDEVPTVKPVNGSSKAPTGNAGENSNEGGSSLPGAAAPGSVAPGASAPGSSVPGASAPGSSAPGSAAPAASAPSSDSGQLDTSSHKSESATGASGTAADSSAAGADAGKSSSVSPK